jgi:hypothetical protein
MRLVLAPALVAVLAAGCSAPAVAPKPPTFQQSGTHISDWNRVAARIADGLQRSGYLAVPGSPANTFHVRAMMADSTFLQGVRQSLEGEIMRRGGMVERSAGRAIVVNLDVDIVRWGGRLPRPGGLQSAAGAVVGLGIMIGDAAPLTAFEGALAVTALGVIGDIAETVTPRFEAEAAWTATIHDGERLAFQMREPMYIHANDVPIYQGALRTAPISSGASAPLLARPIRYAR